MKTRSSPIWHLLLVLACLAGFASSSYAGYTVQQAMKSGYLTVSGYSSSGYAESKLYVKNTSGVALDIDFSACYFWQANDTQRIGLSYEIGTGAYYLRLKSGYTGWLTFSSRCLDMNRHSPVTGTYFASVSTFSSTFVSIQTALRNKASQSAIWAITDGGSLTAAWKAADSRPPVGGGGGGGGSGGSGGSGSTLDLSGSCSWSTSGSSVNIKAGKVANNASSGTSGSLRLRLWATRSSYNGGSMSGYVLGTRSLNPLKARYYYSNISGYVTLSRPPAGYYYTTIALEEYTSSGWVIRDYITFSGTSRF